MLHMNMPLFKQFKRKSYKVLDDCVIGNYLDVKTNNTKTGQ